MRNRQLMAGQIAAMALASLSRDEKAAACRDRYVVEVLNWCAANLVLPEIDCPHCGQDADECDASPCKERRKELRKDKL